MGGTKVDLDLKILPFIKNLGCEEDDCEQLLAEPVQ